MPSLSCPQCRALLRASSLQIGRAQCCPKCRSSVVVVAEGDGAMALRRIVEEPVRAPAEDERHRALAQIDMGQAHVRCPACGDDILGSDRFCPACGAELTGELREEIETRAWRGAMRAWGQGARQRRRKSVRRRRVLRASNLLLWLAMLVLLQGTFRMVWGHFEMEHARRAIRQESTVEDLTLENGETVTREELLAALEQLYWIDALTPLLFAGLLFGMYAWSRRAALPATVTALCLLLVLWLASALIEPRTIFHGLLVKVIALTFLMGGIRAAVVERSERAAHEEELATRRRSLPKHAPGGRGRATA
jgi:Zn-finger nucleic acid-binding protein